MDKEDYMKRITDNNYHADGAGGHRLSVLSEIAWQLKRIADKLDAKGGISEQ